MYKYIKYLLLLAVMSWFLTAVGQENINMQARNGRLRSIGCWHVSVGSEVSMLSNYAIGPKIAFGYGSVRTSFSVDVGSGINLLNYPFYDDNKIRLVQIPIFASLQWHAVRFKNKAILIGAEARYNITTNTSVKHSDITKNVDMEDVAQNYFSLRGKVGLALNKWYLSAFYEYALRPICNQQSIYENRAFDFDALHTSIYERSRIGLSATYHFEF